MCIYEFGGYWNSLGMKIWELLVNRVLEIESIELGYRKKKCYRFWLLLYLDIWWKIEEVCESRGEDNVLCLDYKDNDKIVNRI